MPRSKVLLVDDDLGFLRTMSAALSQDFDVTPSSSPEAAIRHVECEPWDAVVIDIEMPIMSGHALLRRLKELRPNGCYLFLTCLVDDGSYVSSLTLGPADFLNKPISAKRLAAALRYRIGDRLKKDTLGYLDIELSPEETCVRIGAKKIPLTPKEEKILKVLIESPEKKIHRDELVGRIWGDVTVSHHSLDTHLTNLRKKISSSTAAVRVDRDRYVCLVRE